MPGGRRCRRGHRGYQKGRHGRSWHWPQRTLSARRCRTTFISKYHIAATLRCFSRKDNVVNLWQIHEDRFDPRIGGQGEPNLKPLHSKETVYTIGNGYFCTRGTFEEGFPRDEPATLLFGVFDTVPIAKEELANAPVWTPIQLF